MWSMREFIAKMALNVYFCLEKGDEQMVAILCASKILNGAIHSRTKQPWTFADVAPKLKEQVAEILIYDSNCPELVPVEYGGTAE